jgi:pimeloyl-ACP methyl ester carboxylesterase
MPSSPRVLFFHGLESGINGTKSLYLAKHFPHSTTPNLKPYYLLPWSFWKAIVAIYQFKPDIIVGSSFGAFIAMYLLQTQV